MNDQDQTLDKAEDNFSHLESEFKRSQKMFTSLLDSLNAIVYVTDIKTNELLYVNKYSRDIFGDVVGKLCWQALQTGQTGPCDFCTNDKLLTPEGKPKGVYRWEFENSVNGRWYDIHDRAIEWVDGRIARLEIATDITERMNAEEALKERTKLAELQADVGFALTTGKTLHVMLKGCTDALVRHLDALFARIWVLNDAENVLELKSSSGLYTHIDGGHSRVRVGQFKIGLIAEERKPHLTNNVLQDPQVHDNEWVRREGIVSFAGHPLLIGDKLIGVLALFSRQALSLVTLNGLDSIANIIALGIDRKNADNVLVESAEKYRRFFSTVLNGWAYHRIIVDGNGKPVDYVYLDVNHAFEMLTGLKREDIIGRRATEVLHGIEKDPSDYIDRYGDVALYGTSVRFENYSENTGRWYSVSATSPEKGHFITVFDDITERKKLEQKLQEMAITDELTGLLNRRGFFTLIEQQCKIADRTKRNMALLYLDLNNMKSINDNFGHKEGDRALVDTANILRKTFRESDIIARIGGDEFVVLITEPAGDNIESIVSKHIYDNLKSHNKNESRSYKLSLSTGMSYYSPDHPCSIGDLLSIADELMLREKKHHKLS